MPTTYYKRSIAGSTALNLNTAWDLTSPSGAGPAGPPANINDDIARWDALSLGGTLSGAFTANQIVFNDATADISHSAGTTITLGSGGFSQPATNTRAWTELGTFAVGSVNQTWTIYNSSSAAGAVLSALYISNSSGAALTGSSAITIASANDATIPEKAVFRLGGSGTFSGTFNIGNTIYLWFGASNPAFTSATLNINGTGVIVNAASSVSATFLAININNSTTLTGGTWTLNGPVTLGGSSPLTLTVSSAVTLSGSGTLSGVALVKAGASNLTVAKDWSTLPSISVTAGTFTSSYASNMTYNGDITGSGSGAFVRAAASTGTLTLNGTISVPTLTLTSGTGDTIFPTATNRTVSSAIGGSGTITKTGAATLTLTGGGANNGAWAINAGTLNVTTAGFSNTAGVITLSGAGTAITNSGTGTISKPIVLSTGTTGTFSAAIGSITVNTGATAVFNAAFSGTALNGDVTINAASSNAAFNVGTQAGRTRVVIAATGALTTGSPSTIGSGAGAIVSVVSSGPTGTGSSTNGFYAGSSGSATTSVYYRGLTGSTIGNANGGGQFFGGDAGTAGGYCCFDFQGGTFRASHPFNYAYGNLANFSFNFLQGSHTVTAVTVGSGATTGARQQAITVRDGATFTCTTLTMAASSSSADASTSLNISGGSSVTASSGITMTGGTNKRVNLNNGTLTTTTISGGAVYFYGSGNVLNATGEVSAALLLPTDTGVDAITIAGGTGTGYIGAPVVTIVRGAGDTTGSGATARAVVDLDTASPTYGNITSIVVTNPGTGYTVNPVVSFNGGEGASAVVPVATATRQSFAAPSPFVRSVTGLMTLTGTNTFTSELQVTSATGSVRIGAATPAGTLGAVVGGVDTAPVSLVSGALLRFGRSDPRIYSGVISGAGTINVDGGGRASLTGANTFTSAAASIALNTSGSILAIKNNSSIGTGTTFGITVASGTALELDPSSGDLTTLPAKALSLFGTGAGGSAVTGALRNISGNNVFSGTITLGSTSRINSDANSSLTLNSASAVTGPGIGLTLGGAGTTTLTSAIATTTGTVTKDGAGTAALTNAASSYTGLTTLSNGTLEVSVLRDVNGGNSSLGSATTTALGTILFSTGCTLKVSGSYSSATNRILSFAGAAGTVTLDASSTGSVAYTGAWTSASNTARTLTLSGTAPADPNFNTYAATITDNGVGATSLAKTGSNRWILTKLNTHTGNTTVSAGTLMAAPPTLTAKVFGNNTTIVAGNARIQTCSDNNQGGVQHYKNLTLQANSTLRIGGSAIDPNVVMHANFTLPAGGMTWDLTANVFNTPGTYRLLEFVAGELVGAVVSGGTITNITPVLPAGRSAVFTYTTAARPYTVTVTIT